MNESKITDFIASDVLENMTEKERKIFDNVFLLNKDKLQKFKDINIELNTILESPNKTKYIEKLIKEDLNRNLIKDDFMGLKNND